MKHENIDMENDDNKVENYDKDAFVVEDGKLVSYAGDGGDVVIPEGVTSIKNWAFVNGRGLNSIIIPDSVTSIGTYAFGGCGGLHSIVVSAGNTNYRSENNCLIENATNSLILGCPTSIIPEGVTAIGNNAFCDCIGLVAIAIPNSVSCIGDGAFYGQSGLTSIVIPKGVTSIGVAAFYGCSGLTSIIIPNSVNCIGERAFAGCSGLRSIEVDAGNTSYRSENNCLIEKATNALVLGCKASAVPEGVTSIGERAFDGCSGLTSITIPEGVISVGCRAFENCDGLTSISFPKGMTSIDNWAFINCSGLTSITIPEGLTPIGVGAFRGCIGLTSIMYTGTMAQWKGISKGKVWDDCTGAYTVHCTDGDIAKGE